MNNGDMPVTAHMELNIDNQVEVYHEGLTKREHFAGLAMQGLITLKGADCMDMDITAIQCVKMADALLKELEE